MSNAEQQTRVFVALAMPREVIAVLAAVQEQLLATGLPLRLVRPEGIHLTLAFIGEIPAARVPGVADAVGRATAGLQRFTLRAEGVGAFPNARRPRAIWVGVEGDPEARAILQSLYNNVGRELRAERFKFDSKPDPHLTLARVRERAAPEEVQRIGQALHDLLLPQPVAFEVTEVSVVRSVLQRGGSVYTQLAAAPLAAAEG